MSNTTNTTNIHINTAKTHSTAKPVNPIDVPGTPEFEKELHRQAARMALYDLDPEGIAQCSKAVRELMLRSSEQGEEWDTPIFILLKAIEHNNFFH